MKQVLIQILSALVNSDNKLEIKKPNINFKEGFRRIVLACILIYLFFDILDIFRSEYRSLTEIFSDLIVAIIFYLVYLGFVKLLCWIGAGFKGVVIEENETSSFDKMKELRKLKEEEIVEEE